MDPPESMVERTVRAIRDRLDDLGAEGRDQEGTLDGSLWLDGLDGLDAVAEDLARTAISAALEGCTVREVEGTRDRLGNHWWDGWDTPRGWARSQVAEHQDLKLVRRLVITTQPVPTTSEEPA